VERLCWILKIIEGELVEITDVRVYPVQDEKVQAFVSIVFDRCFMVNDIKIIRGKDGLFVSMPSRKRKNGDFKDVAHPLNSETRRWVEERILGSYRAVQSGEAAQHDVVGAVALAAPVVAPAAAAEPAIPPVNGSHGPASAGEAKPSGPRSLEELERVHLGDSFWGTT
jgi:stage V sporulation protein G